MSGALAQKVLLVDDEPDIIELLKYNLEREGYQVSTALNGRMPSRWPRPTGLT